MTWKIIGGFLSGLVSRLATFLGAYWLGKTAGENKGLQREIARGKELVETAEKITEARGNAPSTRDDLVTRLRENGL